ncbi:MAG: cell division protein ZapE [Nocardioides sp.]
MGTRRPRSMPAQEVARALLQAADDADISLDPWQIAAADRLAHLAGTLALPARRRVASGGVYIWGPVGRGKTWLLDAFFDALPTQRKKRVHLHTLLRDLHRAVHAHRSAAHAFDAAVEELLADCAVVCFDELHLHDVGDAMLISRVLHRLGQRDIALVATSNYAPEALLPNPLYHHLFQPSIELIRRRTSVVEVCGPTDYRTSPVVSARGSGGFRSGALVWAGPPRQPATQGLQTPGAATDVELRVGSRVVRALRAEGPRVWFDFAQLCESATSVTDLLALAERFQAWVVVGVPRLADRPPDAQQRFLNLVDVLHDRDVALTLVCEDSPDLLLIGSVCLPDVERAASRLALLRR